ncbi:MAG: hypothetical protein HOF21_02185 [Nitrospina sp.]|nr:hypothetical protein [Nitrospina sp.]
MDEWISFFIEFIVPDDLSEETVELFLRYLADINALTLADDSLWEWKDWGSRIQPENLVSVVQNDLESLCDRESGFALPYFIGFKDLSKKYIDATTELQDEDSLKKNRNRKQRGGAEKSIPASDFSNLQIVKKVGKQLQPFMQIEESIVSRLVGERVSKQDAKKLFHYMFGKMNSKAEPRVWEQLSRKRHR